MRNKTKKYFLKGNTKDLKMQVIINKQERWSAEIEPILFD